jgi:hypothetical protein
MLANVQGNSRVLVDAEHTYMQPAIDALTIRLQQRCNRSEPVVINTYQVTLLSTPHPPLPIYKLCFPQCACIPLLPGNKKLHLRGERDYMPFCWQIGLCASFALVPGWTRPCGICSTQCPSLQCYLKDAAARIERDMQRAAEEGWKFGAKTVRGAYMVVERARAAERGHESPIWDSLQETHDNYNRCISQSITAGICIASCYES